MRNQVGGLPDFSTAPPATPPPVRTPAHSPSPAPGPVSGQWRRSSGRRRRSSRLGVPAWRAARVSKGRMSSRVAKFSMMAMRDAGPSALRSIIEFVERDVRHGHARKSSSKWGDRTNPSFTQRAEEPGCLSSISGRGGGRYDASVD